MFCFIRFQAQVATAPANFPTPVVNGEPVAPVLNTVPAQTRHVELTQQQAAINLLQQQVMYTITHDSTHFCLEEIILVVVWQEESCYIRALKSQKSIFSSLPKPLP